MVDLFEVVRMRRSVRSYEAHALDPQDVQLILQAASRAPSAGNLQSYEVYEVTGDSRRALARAAFEQDFVAQAPIVFVFCAEPGRSAERYGRRGAELYCIQDATIACAYAQLAATARGLASVWVGAFDEQAVARITGAPPGIRPVALLPVGHGAEPGEQTSRRPLNEWVHRAP